MNKLRVYMATQTPDVSDDDDDDKPETAEEQHNNGTGTGHQK